MKIILSQLVFIAAFVFGLMLILSALFHNDRSFSGRSTLNQLGKWGKIQQDIWDLSIFRSLTNFTTRFVFMDKPSEDFLRKRLLRAGIDATPQQYTARKYVIIAFSAILLAFCALLQFWIGIIFIFLLAAFFVLKLRENIDNKIKEKDEAIEEEMPRFVRAICRNLRTNRDVQAVLTSYRKVAGPVLAAEIDILLVQMRTDSITSALQQFQARLGTEDAFRLCSTLIEIDRGIDQTATLDHLADDMALKAKLNNQKMLSLRPAQMRKTYIPAVVVCAAMIFYVLIVFIKNQLNTLF